MYANNPRATFDYSILETFEAGLVLNGQEVKAIRQGKASIKGTYVKLIAKELYLVGATISPYQPKNAKEDYEPQRNRPLLLTKKERDYLIEKSEESGLTLIPLKLYDAHGIIKLTIGIARGKKKGDKREAIIQRETERKIRRIKNIKSQ